jgi:hypothetical protein
MTLRLLAVVLGASSLLLTGADAPEPKPMPAPKEASPPPSSQLHPAPDDAKVVGRCTVSAKSCVEWEGSYAGVDLKGRCQKLKGTWGDGGCPTEKRIGSCTQREFSSDDRMVTLSYAPVKAAEAKAACQKQPRAVFMKE